MQSFCKQAQASSCNVRAIDTHIEGAPVRCSAPAVQALTWGAESAAHLCCRQGRSVVAQRPTPQRATGLRAAQPAGAWLGLLSRCCPHSSFLCHSFAAMEGHQSLRPYWGHPSLRSSDPGLSDLDAASILCLSRQITGTRGPAAEVPHLSRSLTSKPAIAEKHSRSSHYSPWLFESASRSSACSTCSAWPRSLTDLACRLQQSCVRSGARPAGALTALAACSRRVRVPNQLTSGRG